MHNLPHLPHLPNLLLIVKKKNFNELKNFLQFKSVERCEKFRFTVNSNRISYFNVLNKLS